MNVTDWFPRNVEPVRTGFYEVNHPEFGLTMRYFSTHSRKWYLMINHPDYSGPVTSTYQQFEWRGVLHG